MLKHYYIAIFKDKEMSVKRKFLENGENLKLKF